MAKLATIITFLILATGVHAQIPDFTPPTALLGALMHNDATAARTLLQSGADPNEGRFAGMPPVFLAIARQNLDLLRMMVRVAWT